MLDIKFVRENPDLVDKACESRQNAHWDRERFFELDEERRSLIAEVEGLQATRNAASKEIGLPVSTCHASCPSFTLMAYRLPSSLPI